MRGTEVAINDAIHMTNRGGKICLAAFPHDPATVDLPHVVKNNIYLYGIRGEGAAPPIAPWPSWPSGVSTPR